MRDSILKYKSGNTISDIYYCSLFPKLLLGKAISMKFPLHILKKDGERK
jgi:hypothetical protein